MTTQPEALRWAGILQHQAQYDRAEDYKNKAANELRRLYAEVEALKTDAARYRAIRKGLEVDPDNSCIVVSLIDDFGGETLRNEIADAAIDAAIAKAEAA